LFSPDNSDESVEDSLDQCIELLGDAISTHDVYKSLLPDKGGNLDDLYTSFEKHQLIQPESDCLRLAYIHAQQWMGDGSSWEECCKEASKSLVFVVSIGVSSYSITKVEPRLSYE
jgi:hypothetical protein